MHKDFITCYPDDRVSYCCYRNKVKNLNVSFVKLGEEECKVCEMHISHLKEEHMLSEIQHTQSTDGRKNKKVFLNCAKCETFQKHIITATEARSSYQNEKVRVVQSNKMVVSVDMQKVIMLARLPGLKQTVFCERLALFNESFAPVGLLWHETINNPLRMLQAFPLSLFSIFEIAKNLLFGRIIVLVTTRIGSFTLFMSTRLIVSMVQ